MTNTTLTPQRSAQTLAPQAISGLYQFNLRVPASTGDGNIPISIRMGSYETQKGTTIPGKH